MKKCRSCKDTKEINEFAKCKTGKLGVRGTCKKCRSSYMTKYDRDKFIQSKVTQGGYIVYILNNEDYAGKTVNLEKRLSNHRHNNKSVRHEVVDIFKTNEEALYVERQLHEQGLRGNPWRLRKSINNNN